MHGTTHEPAMARWEAGRLPTKPIGGRPLYPHVGKELRRVARGALVRWRGSCYSVPWAYSGKLVGVCQQAGRAQVRHGTDCIADCLLVRRKFLVVREFAGPAGTLCSPTPWLPGKQGPNCHIAAGAGICAAITTR
jgi:hypothetical protein